MTWGLICRAELSRGLGVLTRLMNQYLKPDRTLVITLDSGFDIDLNAFPSATTTHFSNDVLNEHEFKTWAEGLDTVVSCETFYDWRAVEWLRELNVRSVLYVMPELLRLDVPVDEYWYPTTYRLDECPAGLVVPVPCESRPFVDLPYDTDQIRMVHVAGKKALGDRNGTQSLFDCLRVVRGVNRPHMTTYTQSGDHPLPRDTGWHQMVDGPDDRWKMYQNAHVIVMPRRFGGLCLPVIEALSCGLAVVMPEISPNTDWPIIPVSANVGRRYAVPCGKITTHDTDVMSLAMTIANLANDPGLVREAMNRSREWALANTWELSQWPASIDSHLRR